MYDRSPEWNHSIVLLIKLHKKQDPWSWYGGLIWRWYCFICLMSARECRCSKAAFCHFLFLPLATEIFVAEIVVSNSFLSRGHRPFEYWVPTYIKGQIWREGQLWAPTDTKFGGKISPASHYVQCQLTRPTSTPTKECVEAVWGSIPDTAHYLYRFT